MNPTATEMLLHTIKPHVVVIECPVCEDPIFEGQPCPRCVELERLFEAKRKADEERMRFLGTLPCRVERGVVPHAPAPDPMPMPMGAFLVVAGTGISLAVIAGEGGWWLMKRAIEWLALHA